MLWMFQGKFKRARETQHGTGFVACGMLARLVGGGRKVVVESVCPSLTREKRDGSWEL